MGSTLKLKRDPQATILTATLQSYEPAFATDTGALFIYDGASKVFIGACLSGTHSSRPTAAIVGRFYYETDTYALFRDNGVTWDQVASPVSHGSSSHSGTIGTESQITFSTSTGHAHSGTDAKKVSYSSLDSIPSTFAPSSHGSSAHTGTVCSWSGVSDKPTTFAPIIGSGAGDAVAGNDSRLTNARTPTNHNLVDTTGHPVSGLTENHVLRATGATTYGFGTIPSTIVSDWAEAVQDTSAGLITGATHTGISTTYNDTDGKLAFAVTEVDGGLLS